MKNWIEMTVKGTDHLRILFCLVLCSVCCVSVAIERLGCSKSTDILGPRDKEKCLQGYGWMCSHLNLDKIPTNFPAYNKSSKLCLLDLSWNNITVVKDYAFQNLTDLKWLWLNQNKISMIGIKAFIGLPNLIYLNLSTNFLNTSSSFSKAVFEPLVSLQYLNLKNNLIKSYDALEELLKHLGNLKGLLISGCFNCSFGEGFKTFTNLTSLSLSGSLSAKNCNMSTLFDETFVNVPYLEQLFLSFCNIENLTAEVFAPLSNLQILDISYNTKLKFDGMNKVLSGLRNSSIVTLDVSAINEQFEMGIKLTAEHMEPIKHLKNLTKLYIELNKLEVIEKEVFGLIPNTTTLFNLAGNRLTYGKYVSELSTMRYMTYLDLSRQHLNFDPFLQQHQERLYANGANARDYIWTSNFKDDETKMIHPESEKFDLEEYTSLDNEGRTNAHVGPLECLLEEVFLCPSDMTCLCVPEKLQTVVWRASFVYLHIYGLKVFTPNQLRRINLSFNLIEVWEGPVYGLEELEELNLSENICGHMNSTFFDNFQGLRKLNISRNNLGQVFDPAKPDAGQHFKYLRNLTLLDLSENRITAAAQNLFENLESLQYLNLSRNMLTQWNYTLNSKCLRLVDLSDNKLETLPESFRKYLDELANLDPHETCNRTARLTLDLAGNPIQCNCDSRPFLRWMSKSPVEILFYEKDECHLQDGSRLLLTDNDVIPHFVDHLDTECVPYAWIGVSIGIFVISIGICTVVYRYRWKLRYLYYSGRRRHRHTGYDRLFERDAFISYAKSEANFIKSRVVPILEEDHSLRVWVADRDAQAGASVAENLTSAIYSSKKSILLLSRSYLKESWCDYEMNMARVESIESKRKLIIAVLLEDISAKDMPLDYLRLLKTVRSFEYPSHPQDIDTFWASLAEAIREE